MGEVRSYLLSSKTASRFSSIMLLIYVLSSLSAEGILASASGMTFGRSSREPKYKIVFHTASSPFHPDNEQESLVMTNKEGQSFVCFLPVVEETKPLKPVAQPNSTSLIIETDERIKQKTPDELIEGIKEKCIYRLYCSMKDGGLMNSAIRNMCDSYIWKMIRFSCKGRSDGKISEENLTAGSGRVADKTKNQPVQEFLMGVFDPMATADFNQNQSDATVLKDPRSKDASQRYHAHVYKNGTLCDLTNQSRETEIRFVCSELSVVISSIKEISTCKYVVTIQCPMLCKHPMFHQERPMWHAIHCNEDPKDTKATTGEHYKGAQIKMIDDDSDHFAT